MNTYFSHGSSKRLFGGVGALALLLILGVALVDCDGGGGGAAPVTYIEPPPVLKNLMVNFGEYDATTGMAGDFFFAASFDKVFFEFGASVIGPDGPKTLPTFEYILPIGTEVFAVADGVVTKIEYQSASNDYEIATRLSDTSRWRIYYDHVVNVNPAVTIGANIKAGDNLGTAGNFTPPRTDYSRTEFHVNYFITIDPFSQSYNCPMLFLDPGIADTLKTQVLQLMRDWEAFKGNSSLYDDDAMGSVAPGCIKESYLENEL